MTRQTFELVARAIAKHNVDYCLDAVAVTLMQSFEGRSTNFDQKKFLTACLCSELTILAQTR